MAFLIVNYRVRVAAANDPKLSDPAHEQRGLEWGRDGRVRCSAWLGGMVIGQR